ncbi:MAG: filamentous hemagglutinin N-terminal domain-containing protein, partial [Niabella sp.]
MHTQNPLRKRLLVLLTLPLATLSVFAQIIADPNAPGQQQPTVGVTANGIPQINIQTPNAAGVSHNQYQQLDVQAQGAILNNSRETVQTQLGGYISGNPHLLQSGPATTILNEVNSSDPSVLRGFIEVAGQKANVIVANPSGITCDGCGFINAHRSTLTTGVPQFNNGGSLEAYRVTSGMINILGQGMLDPNVNYSAVLARAIEINAKIHANRLTAITSANHIPVDPNHPSQLGPPVPIAANPDHNKPLFALDVAELGSIYAKHIYLIGNEEGLGIRLDKGSAMEAGEFILTSAGEIVHRGSIKAQEEALLQAQQNITVDSGASIATQGDLSISTAATLTNHGTLTTQNNLHLNANQTDNTSGTLHAEHNTTLHNRAHLNNSAGQISAGDTLSISTTPTPPNYRHSAHSAATPTRTQTITNTAGKIHAGKQLTLAAVQLNNTAGQLSSTGDLNLALSGDYTHTGTLSANGALSLSTDGTLTNQALLNALTNLSITAANLDNQTTAELSAGSSLTLNISDTLSNRGLIDAPSSLIQAQTLNNLGSGRLYSDTLAISATTLNNDSETNNNLTQAGVIAARQRLDLGIHTLNNQHQAQLLSLGDLAIGGSLDLNHQASGLADTINNHAATIDASGNLHLAANKLNNTNGGVTTENQIIASETLTEYLIDHETKRRRSDTFLSQGTVIPCNPSNGQGDRCGIPLAVGEIKTHPDKFGTRDYIKPLYLSLIPSAQTTPEYQPDAAIYTHLGLTPPADNASAEQKTQALPALHQAITDYNQSVQNDNRVTNGGHYFQYHYTVTTTQPVVTHSDPGQIRAGGAINLTGNNLTNNKSHILAGGALTGDLANLHNIGLEGIATTTFDGTLRYLSKSRAGNPRASDYKPYTDASIEQTITLPVYQVQSHAKLTPNSHTLPSQTDPQQRTIQPNLSLPSASQY